MTHQTWILVIFPDILPYLLKLYGLYFSIANGIRKDYWKKGGFAFIQRKSIHYSKKTHQNLPRETLMQYRRITNTIHHCSIPSISLDCTHEEYQSLYEIGKENRGADSDSSMLSMLHMNSTSLSNVWKHRREKEKGYLE